MICIVHQTLVSNKCSKSRMVKWARVLQTEDRVMKNCVTSGSIEGVEFVIHLSDYKLSNEGSATQSELQLQQLTKFYLMYSSRSL